MLYRVHPAWTGFELTTLVHRLHSIAQREYIISLCQYICHIMVLHLKEIWSDFIDLRCGEKQNQESAQILYRILIKSFMCLP